MPRDDAKSYRTPLPGLLAALLETGINRALALDPESEARLQRLADRMLQLDIEGVGITLFIAFTTRRVEVGTRSAHEPDTVIAGSPFALFAMAAPEGAGNWTTSDSRVTITGDANLARDLERLFSQLDPDWEGSLSRLLGDVWGYQVAAGLRTGADQARRSATEAGEMVREFVTREGGPVVREEELARFTADVDDLQNMLARLERRLAGPDRNGNPGS
ncbi:MAG: SCP2 sterol-binding domain-containing protein [Xanthomonadales bacterium]